jgi:hypothetical protein
LALPEAVLKRPRKAKAEPVQAESSEAVVESDVELTTLDEALAEA